MRRRRRVASDRASEVRIARGRQPGLHAVLVGRLRPDQIFVGAARQRVDAAVHRWRVRLVDVERALMIVDVEHVDVELGGGGLRQVAGVPDVEVDAVLELGAAERTARQQERLVRAVEVVRAERVDRHAGDRADARADRQAAGADVEVAVRVDLERVRPILRQWAAAVREQLDQVVLRRDVRIDLAVVVRHAARVVALGARVRVRALQIQPRREPPRDRELDRVVVAARLVERADAAEQVQLAREAVRGVVASGAVASWRSSWASASCDHSPGFAMM